MSQNPGVPWDREVQPSGEREWHRNPVLKDAQIPIDPTVFDWSLDDEGDKDSNWIGDQDIPIDSREFEHWHAWEATLDCFPEEANPKGLDIPDGE
eukprot:2884332-Heterocapsa_arctica.AAC.1